MASVSETQMEQTSPSTVNNPLQQFPHKRVATACDYCRKKRLKCTAGRKPCLNCQLYGAECTVTPTHRKRGPAPSQSKASKKIGTKPSNPPNISSLPPPGDSSSSQAAHSATRLSNSATSLPDDAVSIPDAITNIRGRADGPQQEDQINYMDDEHGEEPMLMGLCDPLLDHPAFASLGQEGLSHQDAVLFDELFSNSGFQKSGSDIYFAGLHTPQHHDGSNQMFLQRSLADLAGIPPRSMQAGGSASKVFGSEYLKNFLESKAATKAVVPGLFMRTSPSDNGFIGFISTGVTLAECLKESTGDDTVDTRFKTGEWLSNAVNYVHGAGSPNINDTTHELPSQSLAQAGIEAFFEYVHMFHPVLDQQASRKYWDQLYIQRISSPTSLDIVILHLVVAIGLLFVVKADSASTPVMSMSEQLHQKAWASLHETLISTGLQSVQALILHVMYYMYVGRNSSAWSLCGMAIRNAQGLGLHRNLPIDSGYALEQIRLRSQIWWVAFSLDATLSMAEGRPPAVADSTCDAQLTSTNWQSDDRHASNLFLWKVGLAQIENRLCSVLSRCDTPHARRFALGEVEQWLTKWREDMPVECRPGQEMIPGSTAYLLIASLHLEYFSLARALYWSYMTCVPAHNNETHTNRTMDHLPCYDREYILCLGSARAFVRTLNSAIENGREKRNFPISFPANQYAAALAVLYRNICRNPEHVATRVDLEYFRACKVHLERDAYPEYIVSAFGDLLNVMLCSIEKLLASA